MSEPRVNTLEPGQLVTFRQKKTFYDENIYNNGTERTTGVKNIHVRAPLPETFSFGIGNEVNQLFDTFKIKSDIAQFIGFGFTKTNYDAGLSERQTWRAIENKDITMELNFTAYESGKIDVVQPIIDLMTLAAPVDSGYIGGYQFTWKSPPLVTVLVGELLYFTNVIIKDVSAVFSNKLDNEFNPMSAQVSITFISEDPIGYRGIKGYTDEKSGFAKGYK